MPNIFDDTVAEKMFTLMSIRKSRTEERPTPQQLEEIDEAVSDIFGFAFRAGGGLESAVPQYAIGYVLPKGQTIRLNQDKEKIIGRLEECSYFGHDPFVTLNPVNVSEDELERAELVGTPPSEALSGLVEFAEDFDKHNDN